MASIACCFIHRDVRVEIVLWAFDILKKFKCLKQLNCIKYLETEYIPKLRHRENRKSVTPLLAKEIQNNNNNHSNHSNMNGSQTKSSLLTAKHTSSNASFIPSFARFSISSYRSSRKRSTASSLGPETKICCCLFANQKNDFYQNHNNNSNNNNHRKSSISGNSIYNHEYNKKEGQKKVLFSLSKQDLDIIIKEEEISQTHKSESSKLNEENSILNRPSVRFNADYLNDKSCEPKSLTPNGSVNKVNNDEQNKNENLIFENFKLKENNKKSQSYMNVCNNDDCHKEHVEPETKQRRNSI